MNDYISLRPWQPVEKACIHGGGLSRKSSPEPPHKAGWTGLTAFGGEAAEEFRFLTHSQRSLHLLNRQRCSQVRLRPGRDGTPFRLCESPTEFAKRAACAVQRSKILQVFGSEPEGTLFSKRVPSDTPLNGYLKEAGCHRLVKNDEPQRRGSRFSTAWWDPLCSASRCSGYDRFPGKHGEHTISLHRYNLPTAIMM